VRLAAEQLDAVRLAAGAAGLSRGEWVRRAIEAAIRRGGPESAPAGDDRAEAQWHRCAPHFAGSLTVNVCHSPEARG